MNHDSSPDAPYDRHLGYALFRFTMGINFFMHGAVRVFGNYRGFVDHLAKGFAETWLPGWWVRGFAWVVPPVELVIGAMMVVGLFTRQSLVVGFVLMASFVFGACLQENWSLVGAQMVYVICFYFLVIHLRYNRWSIDRLINRSKGSS